MDQKKKVLMLGGALVVLLIGVGIFLFAMKKPAGETPPPSSPVASPSPPGPSGVQPPGPGGAAIPTAGRPGMPGGAPAMPGGAPGAPGGPGAMASRPGVPMVPGVAGTAGTTNAAAMAAIAPAQPKYVDPFAGWTRILPPPKPGPKNGAGPYRPPPMDRSVPIFEMPGSLSTPGNGESGGGLDNNNNNNNDNNNNDNGGDFFGAVPSPMAGTNLGRNAGWISVDRYGKVTAYFESTDGKIKPIEVGTIINGLRVTSISKDYLVLRDDQTGREEQLKLGTALR